MFDLTQKLLDFSHKKGFDHCEVYVEKIIEKSFDLKNSIDYSKNLNETIGVALRLLKNNKLYFINSTLENEKKIEKLINEASEISFAKNIDAMVLPQSKSNFSYEKINLIDEKYVKDAIFEMDLSAKSFDNRIKEVKSSSIVESQKYSWISNSYGLNAYQAYNTIDVGLSVLAREKNDEIGWFSRKTFDISGVDFESIAKTASQRAIEKLSPLKFSTKKISIVLLNEIAAYMMRYFFNIFSAQSVIDKTTKLEVNQKAFSSVINIVDEPDSENGIKFFVDDEGLPKSPTLVVQKGILKTFLHNTYTSQKLSTENTSNAKRGTFTNPVKVGPANFYLSPSNRSFNEMLKSVDGLLITEIMGMHMANPITGDFSLGVNGFILESGKKAHYIKASTFSDNFYNILNKVIYVSDDLYFSGSVGSPSVWVADCIIGGTN